MSSSEEDPDQKDVLYSENPLWTDVTPIPQDDGPDPVVCIAYSTEFKDVFDYFRAILKSEEISQRAFDLTTSAVMINPQNYTVWWYRRRLLKELKLDLRRELIFLDEFIIDHMKNYQVWGHRKLVVEMLGSISGEKHFVQKVIKEDAKNFHCYQYLQWVITHFKEWDGELEFTERLIFEDERNNSAWNHRYFVLEHTSGFTDDVVKREVAFALQIIQIAPANESVFSYLRGILKGCSIADFAEILQVCVELGSSDRQTSQSLYCLVEYKWAILKNRISAGDTDRKLEFPLFEEIRSHLRDLANTDKVRVKYWNYMESKMGTEFETLTGAS